MSALSLLLVLTLGCCIYARIPTIEYRYRVQFGGLERLPRSSIVMVIYYIIYIYISNAGGRKRSMQLAERERESAILFST